MLMDKKCFFSENSVSSISDRPMAYREFNYRLLRGVIVWMHHLAPFAPTARSIGQDETLVQYLIHRSPLLVKRPSAADE